VSQRLVLQGILAGRVPADSLACEVGGAAWRPIREVAPFTTAFAKLRIDGPTIVDPPLDLGDSTTDNFPLSRVRGDDNDRTVADAGPLTERPAGRPSTTPLQRFEEGIESTVVEATVVEPSQVEEPFPLRERR
jgi:hypothetical protein